MTDFLIETCDNFFPPLIRRQIITDYLYEQKFTHTFGVTYGREKAKFGENWKKYNNIADTEAFFTSIDKEVLNYDILEKKIKTFIQIKFNIKVKEVFRMMLVYIPPNPSFDETAILGPHVDIPNKEHLNLLYYLFDNDADTLFFDRLHDHITFHDRHDYHKVNIHKRVEVKENRAVLFNGLIYHAGNVSKYSKRVTLNVNFFPDVTQNS